MKRLIVLVFSLLFIQPVFAQWQMLNSPLATPEITKLAVAPNGYVYAQSSNRELFRSEDNGLTWSNISTLINAANNFTFGNDGKIYATSAGGIAISTDLGITWERKQLTLDGSIADIEITSNGYIVACQAYGYSTYFNGVYISTDDGNQWTKIVSGLDGEALIGLCKDLFGNLYTITEWGAIFKSTDEGYNWNLMIDLPGVADDIEIDSSNKIFAASSSSGTTSQAIFRSTDLGITWVMVNPTMTFYLFIDEQNNIYASNFNQLQISSDGGDSWVYYNNISSEIRDVAAINGKTYTGTLKGVRITEDMGNNWKLGFKYSDKFVVVNDITIFPTGEICAATSDGIYVSSNYGINWSETPITNSSNLIKQDNLGNIYCSAYNLYKSTNRGIDWDTCIVTPESIVNFFVNDSNNIVVATNSGGSGESSHTFIFKSTDEGANWNTIGSFSGYFTGIGRVYGLTENSNGSIFFSSYYWQYIPGGYVAEEDLIVRTDDNGLSWDTVLEGYFILNMYFFQDTMYLAAMNDWYGYSQNGVYKSYDNGSSLDQIKNGLNGSYAKNIISTPNNILFCATSNGIYRSLNFGELWSNLNLTGLQSIAINSIYYNDGQLFACTDNGIGVFIGELPVELTSFTASVTQNKVQLKWETATELNNNGFEIQRKLENLDWITIGFVNGKGTTTEPTSYTYFDDVSELISNRIYYRLKQIDYNGDYEFSDEIEVITIPLEYGLSQNFPNPFNPSTRIKYEIPENTNVTLEVFDVLGRLMKTLVNENKPAGRYEVEFNASELSSGLYLYKIKVGSFEQTKKMLLLK